MKSVNRGTARITTALAGLFAMVVNTPAFAGSNGIPIQGNQACAIQLYQTNSNGVLIAKAEAGLTGSYRMTAYQALPVNAVDLNLTGRFSSSGGEDTVLSRTNLGMGYVAPGARGGLDELRDAEYGQDAELFVQLDVFDTGGRHICRTRSAMVLPYEFLFPRQRPTHARAQPRVGQPESTRAAQEAAAERRREASAAIARGGQQASPELRRRLQRPVLNRRRY
ncbi:MAG: hypothetical protein P8P99_07560 [Maricaulis sp.]|nr:hypothetical protein [Maricaulis sp.]